MNQQRGGLRPVWSITHRTCATVCTWMQLVTQTSVTSHAWERHCSMMSPGDIIILRDHFGMHGPSLTKCDYGTWLHSSLRWRNCRISQLFHLTSQNTHLPPTLGPSSSSTLTSYLLWVFLHCSAHGSTDIPCSGMRRRLHTNKASGNGVLHMASFPLPTCRLQNPIRFHLLNTCSKTKLLRLPSQPEWSLKPSAGPFGHKALCDCPGCLPMKPALDLALLSQLS
jgi:hypothetical protein